MNESINLTAKINLNEGRTEVVADREFSVFPCVALVEGVHNRLMFLGAEITKFPPLMDGRPACIDHPDSVTASTPEYFSTRTLGQTMNSASMQKPDGRVGLQTELWIDLEKAETLGYGEFVNSINPDANTDNIIEVSCGIFYDKDEKPGKWNGEEYDVIARNIRYDHLAILPDQEGACGSADEEGGGCGIRWLHAMEKTGTADCCDACQIGEDCESTEGINTSMNEEKKPTKSVLTKIRELLLMEDTTEPKAWLELCADDRRQQLWQLVKLENGDDWTWVMAVFETDFVYDQLCTDGKYRFFRRGYSVSEDNMVSLGAKDAEFEVIPMAATQWVAVDGINTSITETTEADMADETKEVKTALTISEEEMAQFNEFKQHLADKAKAEAAELETLRKKVLDSNSKVTLSQLAKIDDKDFLVALAEKDEEEDMEKEDDKDMEEDKEDMAKKPATPAVKGDFSIHSGGASKAERAPMPNQSVLLRKLNSKKANTGDQD